MMKKPLAATLAGFVLTAFSALGYFGYYIYSVKTMHRRQPVAENIEVTSGWTGITPEKPLETKKQVQQLMFAIDEYERTPSENNFGENEVS